MWKVFLVVDINKFVCYNCNLIILCCVINDYNDYNSQVRPNFLNTKVKCVNVATHFVKLS